MGKLMSILDNDPHPTIQPGPTSATMICKGKLYAIKKALVLDALHLSAIHAEP
ncbi:hypothetical protein OCU04_005435 [Sclerotinia nivalis]|uniref:Uncharacterized protein n=1 Tax=Sclerotinia nivalis TaxID=352851 RepID=A0A9X0AP40_9HELO|nr:hypothetical protein OCU04_005435 [Sclerotinia nivalis]